MYTTDHFIRRGAREFPNNIAIKFQGQAFTFAETNDKVNRLATGLRELGVRQGERAAILMKNCNQWIEANFALMKLGTVQVALNARSAMPENEYILNDSEAATLIAGDNFRAGIEAIRPKLPHLKRIVWVGGDAGKDYSFEEILKSNPPNDIFHNATENDLARIAYTSGTTGKPKGVILTHKAGKHLVLNMLTSRVIYQDDAVLHVGPMSHAAGSFIVPHWFRGARNVIMEQFDIEEFFRIIQDEKVTNLMLVPTMIVWMLNHPSLKKYDLSSLRSIGYGAAPMAEDKIKEAIKAFGPILTQGYGQVEAPMTITMLTKDDHIPDGTPEKSKRLLSVGKPYADVEVRVVDDDDKEVPVGEVGEIIVRSDHQMKGYWKNEEETKVALKNGWVHTRDMGYMDELGYIFLVDRKGDMIISGGFNIFPREIEEILNNHPAVLEVAVVGVPDEGWGEAVKAVVALKKGKQVTEEELIDFCKDKLSGFKKPKSIEFLPELPKNNIGKIDKKTIKAKYWEGRSRKI